TDSAIGMRARDLQELGQRLFRRKVAERLDRLSLDLLFSFLLSALRSLAGVQMNRLSPTLSLNGHFRLTLVVVHDDVVPVGRDLGLGPLLFLRGVARGLR